MSEANRAGVGTSPASWLDAVAVADLSEWFPTTTEIRLAEHHFARPGRPRVRTAERVSVTERAPVELEPGLPAPGSVLDKYTLERPIGVGGFAVVYRARHQLLDMVYALKLLRPSVLRRRPELARSLGEEARLAARIHHPNVVRVIDVTIGGEHSYVVMDYVDGLDLSAMLSRKGRLPAKMVLKIVAHVAAALRAGLAQKLVHRDIKPSNILLTRQGVTKLVDFGLARSSAGEFDDSVVGTLGYMSPEHVEHPHAVDHRSDIFSLGVTAYRAMTGVNPVRVAGTAAATTALLRSSSIVSPHRLDPRINAAAADLVMWMLRLDPAARPQDHETLIAAAHTAMGSQASESSR